MAAPALLVTMGALFISQVIFGDALERLGLKAVLTGSGSSSGSSSGSASSSGTSTSAQTGAGTATAGTTADGSSYASLGGLYIGAEG